MTDLDAIRARHVLHAAGSDDGTHPLVDLCNYWTCDGWPCDTAIVLAALDGLTANHEVKMHRYDAALARERRLRDVLTRLVDRIDNREVFTTSEARAALAETPEAGT